MHTAKNAEKTFKTVILVMTDMLKIRPMIVMTVLYRVAVAAQQETLKIVNLVTQGSDLMEPCVGSAQTLCVKSATIITQFVSCAKTNQERMEKGAPHAKIKDVEIV